MKTLIALAKAWHAPIVLTAIVLACMSFRTSAQHQVCFTFDDLPTVAYRLNSNQHQLALTRKLVDTLARYRVPAIGFVNEVKLMQDGVADTFQVNLLKTWLSAGLELGNHTYSHVNYHQTPFSTFTDEIVRGEKITRALCRQYNSPLQYFRHPYLRIGKSKEQHDSLVHFLQQHGYREAPVTIDNEDYLFAHAYSIALQENDQDAMRKIGTAFIQYMEEKLRFYERTSTALFGRNIPHVLLLHANALNSDFLTHLIDLYKRHGYDFVSLDQALADEAYQTPITRYGDYGISWIDRWALSQGRKGDFFKGDPETPDFVREISNRQ